MSAYLKFYTQVRYDYRIVSDIFLCFASDAFNESWKDAVCRAVIKSHAEEFLTSLKISEFAVSQFSGTSYSLFTTHRVENKHESSRKIRYDFLNWIIEKLDKERRQLKIQELEHYRETVHPESEECKMTNVQIKILYGDATSDDYYCSPDDEGFYLWEAAIFIEQWIKE